MGFLGAIGRAVGGIPGMKTMNKALPGGGMPGVNPKPQLGGGLGPSIKPPAMGQSAPNMQQQASEKMNQIMPGGIMKQFPGAMGQFNQSPMWNMPPRGYQSPPIQAPQGSEGPPMQKQMGPSPMGMPPWMRGGGMMQPHVMPNRSQNTGFMRPFGGGMNNPNIQY